MRSRHRQTINTIPQATIGCRSASAQIQGVCVYQATPAMSSESQCSVLSFHDIQRARGLLPRARPWRRNSIREPYAGVIGRGRQCEVRRDRRAGENRRARNAATSLKASRRWRYGDAYARCCQRNETLFVLSAYPCSGRRRQVNRSRRR